MCIRDSPCPDFWHIAANEGCTAIIGLDAHNNKDLETPVYYNRAIEELKTLKILGVRNQGFMFSKKSKVLS